MYVDIIIEVYEYAPHGHGNVCTIDDYIDVREETYNRIRDYHSQGVDDLECMSIPELDKIVSAIKEEHIDFARERYELSTGGNDDDSDDGFIEPEITITVVDEF